MLVTACFFENKNGELCHCAVCFFAIAVIVVSHKGGTHGSV